MLSRKQDVQTVLLCGSAKHGNSFTFEAATSWAMEGRDVVHISSTQIEAMPAVCHDGNGPAAYAFAPSLKLIRFMYLPDYEALIEQLVNLHTFARVPSVLIIDDFDNYLKGDDIRDDMRAIHIAKTCAFLLDTMNACSRTLAKNVYLYVWSSSVLIDNPLTTMYFRNVWIVKEEEKKQEILLHELRSHAVESNTPRQFIYRTCEDGSRMLKQILFQSID